MGDEPYETLGESLSLAPFLENRREYIEGVIKPFNTKRAWRHIVCNPFNRSTIFQLS